MSIRNLACWEAASGRREKNRTRKRRKERRGGEEEKPPSHFHCFFFRFIVRSSRLHSAAQGMSGESGKGGRIREKEGKKKGEEKEVEDKNENPKE